MTDNPKKRLRAMKQKAIHGNLHKWTASTRINVGMSTCEIAAGAKTVMKTLHDEVKKRRIKDVYIGQKGCVGRCYLEPTVEVFQMNRPPVKYDNVDAAKARKIIIDHLVKNKRAPSVADHYDCVSKDCLMDKSRYIFGDIDYFKKQKRIVLRNCGVIDPESIDDYLSVRGYEALATVLADYTPARVIDDVLASGLRGRGGGGFPTGQKWRFVADQQADEKYVICNADEGDPGAFMDRSTIEGDPFTLLESMTIGAYAVGARKGIVYIRAEYPLAVERLKKAIRQAENYNLLGKNILGTNFSFTLEIVLGAGAFVCGEETALINSIQGQRGMPRIRPPYPSVKGLWGKPTLINNVETWASIPVIILDGYAAFAAIGTAKSKGTKVFALAGKVRNTGLVEVPMGTTLGEIIFDIGGGIKGDRKFKAVQTGGPSGGCLPVRYLNTPVDYETLQQLGSIMGSGGMIVMDETDCMVDVARFFLEFTQDESCGKCTPCREGTKRMLELLNRITRGEGKPGDIEKLQQLGDTIKKTALCGLGQTAPNPVLSTINYFRHEYEAHIKERKCPAIVCGDLFVAACQHACPVHIDIPGYIGLIRDGKPGESLELILERNILPAICGRVCHHPCEVNCRRGKVDEAVAIMELKRFVADYDTAQHRIALKKHTGTKHPEAIAVVGSGPSGLACAYWLASRGYKVTVFESEKVAGGMFRLGIPEYRLPKQIAERDVQRIKAAGVTIKTGVTVGKDVSLSQLRKQGFKAIFLGIGVWQERLLNIPGENAKGVLRSLEFLKSCHKADLRAITSSHSLRVGGDQVVIRGKKIAVIGGGNAAVDVARTAVRLGAAEVMIIYRRTKDAMPAFQDEIEAAEAEGVVLHCLLNPVAITRKQGKVAAIECSRMELGEFDVSSRRKAVATNDVVAISADIVITAIGATPELSGLVSRDVPLEITKQGIIAVDPLTLATNVPGIFAGGDAVNGGATIVESLADGERAAVSIDRFLRGEDMSEDRFVIKGMRKEVSYIDPAADVKIQYRPVIQEEALDKRVHCFIEVDHGYTKKEAREEVDRCLRCDRKDTEVKS